VKNGLKRRQRTHWTSPIQSPLWGSSNNRFTNERGEAGADHKTPQFFSLRESSISKRGNPIGRKDFFVTLGRKETPEYKKERKGDTRFPNKGGTLAAPASPSEDNLTSLVKGGHRAAKAGRCLNKKGPLREGGQPQGQGATEGHGRIVKRHDTNRKKDRGSPSIGRRKERQSLYRAVKDKLQ